jgi:SAM-dependent methyltransferase
VSVEIPFHPDREREELRAYLGDAYEESHLRGYEALIEDEYQRLGDEEALYRTSEAYLYNLTAFAMTGTKRPYHATIGARFRAGARILDYGCGIGSDGLALLEAGYDVSFADFENPSTRYLRWRLQRRGFDADIYDLDAGAPPGGFDLAYAFDVIEHVEDPFAFLADMEAQADAVLVNFLESEEDETALHHELPVRELLAHAAERRVRSYRRHHGRSHLVLYESRPSSGLSRVRSRAALAGGRIRSRLG